MFSPNPTTRCFRNLLAVLTAIGMLAIGPGATTVAERYLDGIPLQAVS